MQLLETAAHVIGSMLLFVAAAMGSSALVAVIRGEFEVAGCYLVPTEDRLRTALEGLSAAVMAESNIISLKAAA